MKPNEVFFIDEMPEDKNQFNVAIHDWRRKQRWLKIKLAALLFVVFSCFGVSAGGMYVVSQYVSERQEHVVLLPLVIQGTEGERYAQ